jgi:hypothetical protein
MASRWDDPSWWPKPRPPKPPTNEQVVLALGLPFIAVGVALLLFLNARHSGHKPSAAAGRTAAAQVTTTTSAEESSRQAFQDCMKSAGAGSGGFQPRGRFGRGGPSEKFREAYEVCRGLLQSGNPSAPPPKAAKPAAPPVA